MRRGLKDFKGKEAIFIDASIFLHHAFDANIHATEFLKRIETTHLRAYTSALVMEELTFKLIMQSASNYLRKVTLQALKSLLHDAKAREKVFKPILEYRGYIDTLKGFGLSILDLTDKDMARALQKARTYGLMAADAADLAVMERKGILHLASGDRDFEAVDAITLWAPD